MTIVEPLKRVHVVAKVPVDGAVAQFVGAAGGLHGCAPLAVAVKHALVRLGFRRKENHVLAFGTEVLALGGEEF